MMSNLLQAAKDVGLDSVQMEYDIAHHAGRLFEEDLQFAKEWGVKGFPTIYFIDGDDNQFKVYGSKHYQVYEQALLQLLPAGVQKAVTSSYENILKGYDTVTLKEFAVFFDKTLVDAESILDGLEKERKVMRMVAKAGIFWKLIRE